MGIEGSCFLVNQVHVLCNLKHQSFILILTTMNILQSGGIRRWKMTRQFFLRILSHVALQNVLSLSEVMFAVKRLRHKQRYMRKGSDDESLSNGEKLA